MYDANAAGDYLSDMLSRELAGNSAKAEAIDARAERIEKELSQGNSFQGLDIDQVLEAVLEGDGILEALKTAYLYGNAHCISLLVDAEISRIADATAPGLVQAALDSALDTSTQP